MNYEISAEFSTDRALTEEELNTLVAMISLQIEEPQNKKGDPEEFETRGITVCPRIYPRVAEVLAEMMARPANGWVISYEYPDTIGVWHGSFISDDQFINFGDVNGYFGFNDTHGDVSGDTEGITNPAEIVRSFWAQVGKFYPNLVDVCSICGENNLDDELCFNCKASRECVNCCGCE